MPLFCVGSAKPFVKPVENSDNFDHPQIIFTEGIKSEFLRCFCAMWLSDQSSSQPVPALQKTITKTKKTRDTETKTLWLFHQSLQTTNAKHKHKTQNTNAKQNKTQKHKKYKIITNQHKSKRYKKHKNDTDRKDPKMQSNSSLQETNKNKTKKHNTRQGFS